MVLVLLRIIEKRKSERGGVLCMRDSLGVGNKVWVETLGMYERYVVESWGVESQGKIIRKWSGILGGKE